MSQAVAMRPQSIPSSVANKLRGLRAKVTFWLIVDGLAKVVLCAILLAAIDFGIDWFAHLDKWQRLFMLVACGGALCAAVYFFLIRPLLVHISDDALVLEVERHHGEELGESLISAVQFSRDPNPEAHGVSRQLVDAAIEQGTQRAGNISFGTILNTPWLVANLLILAVGIAVIGATGVAVANNEIADAWFNRLMLGDAEYPQDVHLNVEYAQDRELKIPRGDPWPLVFTVDRERSKEGVVVDKVDVQFKRRSGTVTETAEVREKGERFGVELPSVVEPFEFRGIANGDYTPWYKATLVERPSVSELKLIKKFPAYTGAEDETLPPGSGPFYVLTGGELKIEGKANKDLSQALLKFSVKKIVTETITDGEAEREIEKEVVERKHIAMDIQGDSFSTLVAGEDLVSGAYQIELIDTEEIAQPGKSVPGPLESKRPTRFSIRVRDDRAPDLVVKMYGISSMVVPRAMIPFTCDVKDNFAITSVGLDWQWRHQDNEAASDEGNFDIEQVKEELGKKDIEFDHIFDIEDMQILPGSVLTFRLTAEDNKKPEASLGESPVFPLRVVTEAELRTDLMRREREQRGELERLAKSQDEITVECRAMLAGTREAATLETEQRQLLMRLQKQEKLIGSGTASIGRRMDAILLEAKNNRLIEDSRKWRTNMENEIIGPLYKIADEMVPALQTKMDRIRQRADSAERNQAFEEAIADQLAIAQQMQSILKFMEKAEGYQQVVNLAYETVKIQESVLDLTRKEREERVRRILEGKEKEEEEENESASGQG